MTPEQTADFIAAARSQMGVRWRHQGRGINGLDCGGLVIFALRAIGRDPVDSVGYGREPYLGSLRNIMASNFGEPINKADMQAGDCLLMAFGGEPQHVAILTDYPHGGFAMLHAHSRDKRVVEHRLDEVWSSRIVEAFRP